MELTPLNPDSGRSVGGSIDGWTDECGLLISARGSQAEMRDW